MRTRPTDAKIVLLGSSLMVAAVSECDALVTQKKLDLTEYRGADYFDRRLSEQFKENFRTINLSGPGQIPSDAFLTLQAALRQGVHPNVVIYGLAPRDFFDGTLQSATDTEAFKYLSRIVEIEPDVFNDVSPNFIERLDWSIRNHVWLYRYSPELSMRLNESCTQSLQTAVKLLTMIGVDYSLPLLSNSAKCVLENYNRFDIAPGTLIASAAARRCDEQFVDNSRDYKDRYRNPDYGIYQRQMRFLERVALLCEENNIELILVNMPIMRTNLVLLDEHAHSRYLQDLRKFTARHVLSFIDACEPQHYDRADYRDTVHLNAYGGKKFLDGLVAQLRAHRSAARAILAAGGAREVKRLASSHSTAVDNIQ